MSLSWANRKARLQALLQSRGDEDKDGLALDRLLHGQSVIGKTSRTSEIDSIRFQDKDIAVVGHLEYGQFGIIDVVNCRLNGRVYVRKSTEKRFAARTRDQCFPQLERNILLQATKTNSPWAPHLFCAYQTPTHLNLVMDYAEGGTLWDVLESSPLEGRVSEEDLRWWTPQIISAIHWCHSQDFVHRDIKPHNFVLTPDGHVLLIDFGSAAPLLPPEPDGTRLIPRQYCLVPCGTCDYISPEILQAHEQALVALEMDEGSDTSRADTGSESYGVETDWWSLGAMLYEMAYGVAPFFAEDIRKTYQRIMDHKRSLRFVPMIPISSAYKDFLSRLLTDAEFRLGRRGINEVTEHLVFEGVNWSNLSSQSTPSDLHLPQFAYPEPDGRPNPQDRASEYDESHSQGFAFSALFQSSKVTSSPGLSILHSSPSINEASPVQGTASSFIGFSWGPTVDLVGDIASTEPPNTTYLSPESNLATPRPSRLSSAYQATPNLLAPPSHRAASAPVFDSPRFATPIRPSMLTPHRTLPRTGTIRRSTRRAVSDREAMKQLVNCVGMSAHKKVLESGRKPRILTSFSRSGTSSKKELRFVASPTVVVPKKNGLHISVERNPGSDFVISSESEDTDSDAPPSPSPSPRPGSAMSMMSRRSGTPTLTTTFSARTSLATLSARDILIGMPSSDRSNVVSRRDRDTAGKYPSPLSNVTFDDATFDELESKHTSIIENIEDIEMRLGEVAVLMARQA